MSSNVFPSAQIVIENKIEDYANRDNSVFTPKIQNIATSILAELNKDYNKLFNLCSNNSESLQSIAGSINSMRFKLKKYRDIFTKEKTLEYNAFLVLVNNLSKNFNLFLKSWKDIYEYDKNKITEFGVDIENLTTDQAEELKIKNVYDLKIDIS